MKKIGFIFLAACTLVVTSGCSYSKVDPEGARAAMMKFGGEAEFERVALDKSKLVFRVVGDGVIADFQIFAASNCADRTVIGSVMDAGHLNVFPWVAAAVQRRNEDINGSKPFRVLEIEPTRVVRVQASGTGIAWARGSRNRYCEPEAVQFIPEVGKAYEVLLVRTAPRSCLIAITQRDGGDRSEPINVSKMEKCPFRSGE